VLSDRELEVFQLLGQGLGVRQIAEQLFVSPKTVEAHREHIKQKMNFPSSAELLRFAIEYTLKGG
jgi:DNA-binding NarL/FixJ family response regulator